MLLVLCYDERLKKGRLYKSETSFCSHIFTTVRLPRESALLGQSFSH